MNPFTNWMASVMGVYAWGVIACVSFGLFPIEKSISDGWFAAALAGLTAFNAACCAIREFAPKWNTHQ